MSISVPSRAIDSVARIYFHSSWCVSLAVNGHRMGSTLVDARPENRRLSRLCDRLFGGYCSVVSARIGATLPQCQAARIIIRHPFDPAPYPQHHWRLPLSNDLAYDENPAAAVGTRIATSASVRTEKRTVDRRILVDDDWRRVGHVGAPFSSLFSLGGL